MPFFEIYLGVGGINTNFLRQGFDFLFLNIALINPDAFPQEIPINSEPSKRLGAMRKTKILKFRYI